MVYILLLLLHIVYLRSVFIGQ